MRFAGNKRVPFNFPSDDARAEHREHLDAMAYDDRKFGYNPYAYSDETFSSNVWDAIAKHEKEFGDTESVYGKLTQIPIDIQRTTEYYPNNNPEYRVQSSDFPKKYLDLRSQKELVSKLNLDKIIDEDKIEYVQTALIREIKDEILGRRVQENARQDLLNKLEFGVAGDVPVTLNMTKGKNEERLRLKRIKEIANKLKESNTRVDGKVEGWNTEPLLPDDIPF